MNRVVWMFGAAVVALMAACGPAPKDSFGPDGNGVSLRNLTETDVAANSAAVRKLVQGTLIPTPSDTRSRHYVLRERTAVGGTIIAILREERGDKVAYARVETDCAKRLFHVVGVGSSRARAELARAHDGPLRPIAGLPLRQEMAAFLCERAGTPLAPAKG